MDQIYTTNGGEFLNASTSEDWTVYYLRLPSNRLELWAWLESDRLLNPVFREFYSERDVVFEERRMRTDATPLGKYDESFNALFWDAFQYQWPVVGWASDIPTYTLAQAKDYFATYYAPNNLTGVLVGDFKVAEIKPLLDRYFGRIPRGKTEPAEIVTLEPKQLAEKRMNAEAETSPTVRIWWKSVPALHKDGPALDVLADVLSGRTGRLYKGVVMGRKIANDGSASNDQERYGGAFKVEMTVKDGQEPAAVEAAIYQEIKRLQDEPLPADELQKVKNQEKANSYRRLVNPTFIMFQLLIADATGDWRSLNTYADKVDAVTAADVQRVAKEYFDKESRTVGVFLRKASSAPADAELLALPAEAQAMVKQATQQLQAQTDPAKIRAGIAQMQAMAGQAPPEVKPALELILKRAQERLAALEGGKK
jgi:predicted Zn-dependent peptidase